MTAKRRYSLLICLQAHPGTATYTVDEYEHLDSVVNMNTQVTNIMESMSKFMKAHPEGVHLICFSQGNLTLYALMDSSFWFDTINLGWPIVYNEGSYVIISKQNQPM